MKLNLCLLLLVLAGSATVQAQQATTCVTIDGCNADIAILVDKSGSITDPKDGGAPENWGLLKNFIYDIMRSSNFGEVDDEGALYSVLFFANQANLKVKFDTCKDMDCMNRTIEAVNAPGGETHTDAALREALTNIFSPAGGDRLQSPDILLLITDGVPNPYIKAELDATVAEVKRRNIRIIGIGIGNNVDHDIMRGIVTFPPDENYFQIVDFSAVRAELENILGRACVFCTVDCFDQWTPWSPCPVTCGTGTVTRTRRKFEIADAACAPGETIETKPCDAGPCKEGPCDPKTIDFYNAAFSVDSYENVKEKLFLGSWYLARWYLSPDTNVSSERYDVSQYGYKKAGYPDNIFINDFGRDKLKQCCNDMTEIIAELQEDGSLHWSFGDKMTNPPDARVAIVFSNEYFMAMITCYGPKFVEKRCTYYDASFWTRCNPPREQDLCKGEAVLKKLCYPHERLFVCAKHQMDCHESPMDDNCECYDDKKDKKKDKCNKDDDECPMKKKRKDYEDDDNKKGKRRDDYDDDDDDDWRRMRRWRREDDDDWRRMRRWRREDDDDWRRMRRWRKEERRMKRRRMRDYYDDDM